MQSYEDGRLAVFETLVTDWSALRKDECEGWQLLYHEKQHKEPSKLHIAHFQSSNKFAVMSLAISPDYKFAWTVGADHLNVRWTLPEGVSSTLGLHLYSFAIGSRR